MTTSQGPSTRAIVGVVAFLNLFVNGIVSVTLVHSHRQQMQISQINSEITGRVLEEGISRFIDKVDLTLLSVMDEVTRENQSGGVDSRMMTAVLARYGQRLPEALGLRLADRSGHLLAASGPVKDWDGTIADSEPFRHWGEGQDSGLFLSNPLAGEISGQPIIVMARKLVDADGHFAGQINVSVALEQLNRVLNIAQLGANGSVTLSNKDGQVIARTPNPVDVAALLSRSLYLPTVYHLIQSGHPADFFRAESSVDHISRSYAFRRVTGRDWYLIVGTADHDALASWWRQVEGMAALSASFAVLTVVGGLVLLRGSRQRQAINAELAARELSQKEQYQRLFADSPDAYLIMELDGGRVGDCNHAAESLLRGSRDLILGRTPDQLSPPVQPDGRSSREAAAEKIVEVLRDGRHRFEWVHQRFDGDAFWAEVTISLSTYQGRPVLFVAWRDISDRKRMEMALAESESRFRLMTASIKDYAIFMLDPDGRVVTWNEGAKRLKGYEEGEILGRSMDCFYSPEEVAAGKPALLLAETAANERKEDEGWRVRKDGSRFYADVVITALRNEAGALIGFAKITRDITERKMLEFNLKRSNAEIARFADVHAHHLQEPIRRLTAFCKNLTRQLSGKLDDAGAMASLKFIDQESRRLRNLVHDIELYIAADRPLGKIESQDTMAILDEVVADKRQLLEEVGGVVEMSQLPYVAIDRRRLYEIFSIVLDNAIRYRSPDRLLCVKVQGMQANGKVILRVEDNGIGIPAEFRERVFRIFERFDPHDDVDSTGIGLSIVRRIAESVGGEARIEEAADDGVAVVIVLGDGGQDGRRNEE